METLKVLADIAKDLPETALWVILGFFIYKSFIVGSIYGVARLAISKTHDVLTVFAKRAPRPKVVSVEELHGVKLLVDARPPLIFLLKSMTRSGLNYLHESDIAELAKAWAEYQERKNQPKKKGESNDG